MRTLFLAPQPFFQERGTPIAVRLALEVLSKRPGISIDLLTYNEGSDVTIPGVSITRIPHLPGLTGIRPGISFKKLFCDFLFFFSALRLVLQAKNSRPYQLIHAVEESVFIAWIFKHLFGIPYVYDMDSSLAMQLTEKWWFLRPLGPFISRIEKIAIAGSVAVVPVCDTLAALAEKHGAPDIEIIRDISLLEGQSEDGETNIRKLIGAKDSEELILYIGNLEPYQGIDLLLDSFATALQKHKNAHLVIVGGVSEHITMYRNKADSLGISNNTHLIGPRPMHALRSLLHQADILASPRIRGDNTPMKIYSYMHSGRAIIATDLPTNTQVLDKSCAMLAEPSAQHFGEALLTLLSDKELRLQLGKTAFLLAEQRYTSEVFSRSLNQLYQRIEERIRS